MLDLAKADLEYYDKIIEISRNRLRPVTSPRSTSIASSYCGCSTSRRLQTAIVNLRTAKIQLLQLLNDRTPVDQFDVTGPFRLFRLAQAARGLSADRARYASRPPRGAADHRQCEDGIISWRISNGSTDPTYSRGRRTIPSFNNPKSRLKIPSAAASTFRCASSIAIRARSSAR